MKRTLVLIAALAVVAIDAGPAAAQSDVSVERSPVTFTLTSATCPKLPDGTRIRASGRQVSRTRTTTDAAGITTVVNYTEALGVARDQDKNRYLFDYRNSFHIVNSVAAPAQYVGTMFDLFSLVGTGRVTLSNGFVAIYTTDLGEAASFQPLLAWGNPIDFATGAAHCDPL